MYILDTNAVIYYVKEESNVVSIIEDIYTKNVPVYVSVITEAELFGFPQLSDEEAERIEKFLHTVSIIPMDSQIARLTGTIRKKYQLSIADSVMLPKHGQNISYMDAEMIGSYFEEMLQTSRRLVWPPRSVSLRHLCKFLAQNKIRLFPHWRNVCLGHVCCCHCTFYEYAVADEKRGRF